MRISLRAFSKAAFPSNETVEAISTVFPPLPTRPRRRLRLQLEAPRWKNEIERLAGLKMAKAPDPELEDLVRQILKRYPVHPNQILHTLYASNDFQSMRILIQYGVDPGGFEHLIPKSVRDLEFCGHHSGPSLHDRSLPILRQYGPPHDRANLSHSEATQFQVSDRFRYIQHPRPPLPEKGFSAEPMQVISYLFQFLDVRDHPSFIRDAFFKIQKQTIQRLAERERLTAREAEMLTATLNVHYLQGVLDLEELGALHLSLTKYFLWPEFFNIESLFAEVRRAFCQEMFNAMNVNLQISADMPDIQLSRRIIPQSGFQEFKKIGIGFVNGIMNSESAAIEHACRLSAFAEGNVQLIYNCSHFIFSDVGEYILEKLTGQHLLPSLLLQLQWEEFFKTHGEDAQFLQVCHSAGANHVKIALRNCPYKDRITVLAVAPASIITPQECRDAENIASQLDKVPLINDPAEKKYLKILPVHPEETSAILDHGFDSMTYEDYIIEFIKKFKAENEI